MGNDVEFDYDGEHIKSTNTLLQQTTVLDARQQSIQNHILALESQITQLSQMVQQEQKQSQPDFDKIRKLQGAINHTMTLLADWYRLFREFADTKFKYHKQVTDLAAKHIHLKEIEIKRLSKGGNSMTQDFINMLSGITNGNMQTVDQTIHELNDMDDYKME